MAKDTVIPIKFNRQLESCEIEALVEHMGKFEELIGIKVDYITPSAVKRRVEKQQQETTSSCTIDGVVFSEERAEVCPTCRNSPFESEFSNQVRIRKCVDCGK